MFIYRDKSSDADDDDDTPIVCSAKIINSRNLMKYEILDSDDDNDDDYKNDLAYHTAKDYNNSNSGKNHLAKTATYHM